MTVLLTGASGFLGSHIAEQLTQAGRTVRVLVRKSSDTSFLKTLENVEYCEGAIDDVASLERAVAGVEAVIHSAGLVRARSAEEFMLVNAVGTERLASAALKHAKDLRRFVLVSSQAAGGPSDAYGTPVKAGCVPRPVTHYGRSKLAAEQALTQHVDHLPSVILRPSAVYGPRDKEVLVFFKSIAKGVLPLTNPVHQKLSMVHGADCAAACIRAIDADVPSGSVYYVSDGEIHTFGELIELTETALRRRAMVRVPLPQRLVRAAALASELYGRATDRAMMFTRDKCNELFEQWVCDSTETRKALGWEPRISFAEGVKQTAEWYKKMGWL
jgi:nucleoside-diphosphate-sugar epimerase